MKERFRNILTKRRRKWGVLVLALTLLAAIASACAFGLRQTEQEPQQADTGTNTPDQPDDSTTAPPVSMSGSTESFTYNGLELTVTNVRETGQRTAVIDSGETVPYTIYLCYPGAQASIIRADMDEGYPEWAFDLASGGHIDITNDTGPVEITADTLGIYNKEASIYVLRFELYEEAEPVLPGQGEEPDIPELPPEDEELDNPGSDVPELPPAGTDMGLYKSVLLGERTFRDTGTGQDLTMDDIKQAITDEEDITISVPRFAIVDLDYDSVPEVVLWLNINGVNDVGSMVLHGIGGEVYGYVLFTRQFNDLKTDGTFAWSGGASNNGYGTLTFSETGYTQNEAAALGDTDVSWYAFTDNNMARIFG